MPCCLLKRLQPVCRSSVRHIGYESLFQGSYLVSALQGCVSQTLKGVSKLQVNEINEMSFKIGVEYDVAVDMGQIDFRWIECNCLQTCWN